MSHLVFLKDQQKHQLKNKPPSAALGGFMSKPDMTGRNWQARIPADLMCIKKAIRIERDRLFELELSTGKEPEDCETFHLEWLEQERARGVQQIVTNF